MSAATATTDPAARATLREAIDEIARGAAEHDRAGVFPHAALRALRDCGALAWGARVGVQRPSAVGELSLVRRVAAADGSVGRIFDGHLNAVERIAVHAATPLCEELLLAVVRDGLRLGVWGADPAPGEGQPATLRAGRAPRRQDVLLGRGRARSWPWSTSAIRTPMRPDWWPIDLRDSPHVEIDESWFQSPGLRASVSHRVVFDAAPVLAILGRPGVLTTDPWFSRDALRTAATLGGHGRHRRGGGAGRARRATRRDRPRVARGRPHRWSRERRSTRGSDRRRRRWTSTTGGCRRSQSTRAPRSRPHAGRCSTRPLRACRLEGDRDRRDAGPCATRPRAAAAPASP